MNITDSQTVLGIVFATSLVVANLIAAKIAFFQLPIVGAAPIPAGFFAIAVSFLCTDLLGEIHGKETARRVVNATVVALGVAWILVYMAIAFPAAPFYDATAFNNVFGASGTIVTAGIITTIVSQNLDVTIFDYLRGYTNGSHRWLRNLGSTSVSQFVDTTLFIVLGFWVLPQVMSGQVTPLAALPALIGGQYVVKLLVAVADTPAFYVLSAVAQRRSGAVVAEKQYE